MASTAFGIQPETAVKLKKKKYMELVPWSYKLQISGIDVIKSPLLPHNSEQLEGV